MNGSRRLLAALTDTAPGAPPRVVPGTVVSVAYGAALDGSAVVVIDWHGAQSPVAYLSSYSPQVGDVVALLTQGPQTLILGKISGTPS